MDWILIFFPQFSSKYPRFGEEFGHVGESPMAQILSPICLLKPQIWGIPPETVTLMNIAVFFFASWSKDTELSHASLDTSDEDVHSKITIITVLKFALDNAKLAQITLIWLNGDDFITLSISQTWNRSVQIGCNQWCPRQRSNSKANQLPLQQFKPVYEFQPGWNFHPHHQRVEMGTVTLPALMKIINQSLREGRFPQA